MIDQSIRKKLLSCIIPKSTNIFVSALGIDSDRPVRVINRTIMKSLTDRDRFLKDYLLPHGVVCHADSRISLK